MKTKLSKLLKSRFNRLPRRVFGPNEISQFLAQHRQEWGVSAVSIQQLLEAGGLLSAAASRPTGWEPIDLTPQTEFGEQLFVTRRAETDKRPYAQANSLFGR